MPMIRGNNLLKVSALWNLKINVNQSLGLYDIITNVLFVIQFSQGREAPLGISLL